MKTIDIQEIFNCYVYFNKFNIKLINVIPIELNLTIEKLYEISEFFHKDYI
jgi:hypothetical protein